MVKSGNSITTNLLEERDTQEKDGVEINIKNIWDTSKYIKALDHIIFFPNVYVEGSYHHFNNTKIKHFDKYAVASLNIDDKLLLGNVLYPCNNSLFSSEIQILLQNIKRTGIVIKFKVGELNITPNRENIIYNSETIKLISDRVKDVWKELLEKANAKSITDYTDIIEYSEAINSAMYYLPFSEEISFRYTYSEGPIIIDKQDKKSITYKGKNLENSSHTLYTILLSTIPNFKAVVSSDKVTTGKIPYRYIEFTKVRNKSNLISVPQGTRLLESIKLYLKKFYISYCVVDTITKASIESWLNDISSYKTDNNKTIILDALYDYFSTKVTSIDFKTDKDYLKFKAEYDKDKKENRGKLITNNLILYINKCSEYSYYAKKDFTSWSSLIQYINELKRGVILITRDVDTGLYEDIARIRDYVIIKARKDIIKALEDQNLKCIVDKNWLLKEDPIIDKVYTVDKCLGIKFSTYILDELKFTIPKYLYEEFKKEIVPLTAIPHISKCYYRSVGKTNSYIEYLCKELNKYLESWTEAATISGTRNSILTAAVVMKTKSYRVSREAYSLIKDNQLIKILCKK